jgi:hypothetical protein
VETRTSQKSSTGRYFLLDVLVMALVVALIAFLVSTMGVRTKEAQLQSECQSRLLALAQAEQGYLVKHSVYSEDLNALRPFLDPEKRNIPFRCPITGNDYQVKVQGSRYLILAPGTDYSISTGDPSW